MCRFLSILAVLAIASTSAAEAKTVKIFVALCDNATQGIVPVGAKIGDGNVPGDNLYWGSAEGIRTWFKRSAKWSIAEAGVPPVEPIMETISATHKKHGLVLTAEAYRGSAIRQCVEDFEKAVASDAYDFVAFVGHNALMDFDFPAPASQSPNGTSVAVVCCKSRVYFKDRVVALGGTPVLLTEQFMYPGAFIMHDAIEAWAIGGKPEDLRNAAGKAYAKNQKISVKSATGVFSDIK